MFCRPKLGKILAIERYLEYFRMKWIKDLYKMKKILAFAGSNSSSSINFELVKYTTNLLETYEIQLLNMVDYQLPMYSIDVENTHGFSAIVKQLKENIQNADGLVIAVNEHNGGPSAYFKNMLDWLSRLDRNFLKEKKVLLMATSPGRGGGSGALEIVKRTLPFFGGEVVATFSLPSFNHNFDQEQGITEIGLAKDHKKVLQQFSAQI